MHDDDDDDDDDDGGGGNMLTSTSISSSAEDAPNIQVHGATLRHSAWLCDTRTPVDSVNFARN